MRREPEVSILARRKGANGLPAPAQQTAEAFPLYRVIQDDGSAPPDQIGLPDADLVALYRWMVLNRMLDERMVTMQRQGRINFYIGSIGEELRLLGLAEQAAPGEKGLHPQEGILLAPRLDELRGTVGPWIVGGGVPLHAIGHALEQRRSAALRRALSRADGGAVDGEQVVTVHALAADAVGERLLGDGLGRGLPLPRHADGPAVVSTGEDDRYLVHPREVQAGVEVVRTGGALAEVDERDHVVSLDARRPRGAHRMCDLGADGRADGGVESGTPGLVAGHLVAEHDVAGVA